MLHWLIQSHTISIVIIGIFLLSHYAYGIENQTQNKSINLENVLAKYWSWWTNSPEDAPESNPICSMGMDSESSFVFFLDSFEVGDVSYDCTKDPVPKGYKIMFPLLTAFCSQGDAGLYGKSYQEIRDCTLNLDRGKLIGTVSIDDKVVVNISKDNGNGIEMKGLLQNNLPQYSYYKEVFSKEFVDLLASTNTTIPTNWEKPEEFEKNPIYYKAVVHCECVVIDSNELDGGTHILKYVVESTGGKSSVDLEDTGWKFKSTATYNISVQ